MERGVRDFFDPNRDGGFDASQFFVDARGPGMGSDGGMLEMMGGMGMGMGPEGDFAPGGEFEGGEGGMPLEEFGRGGAFFSDEGVSQFQPPVSFDMGDGGQAMAWEDGMSQVVRDDGGFTVFWGDGKAREREVFEDGGYIQTNPDGTVHQENADGSGQFTSITGDVTVTEVTDDGSLLTTREDGATVLKRDDAGEDV
jgi:hypothetical protein